MSKKKYPLYYCFAVLFECPYLLLKYLSEFKVKKKSTTLMPLVVLWPIPTINKLIQTQCQREHFYSKFLKVYNSLRCHKN